MPIEKAFLVSKSVNYANDFLIIIIHSHYASVPNASRLQSSSNYYMNLFLRARQSSVRARKGQHIVSKSCCPMCLAHLVGDIELPRCHGFLLETNQQSPFIVENESASANQQGILERLGQLTIATHVQETLNQLQSP